MSFHNRNQKEIQKNLFHKRNYFKNNSKKIKVYKLKKAHYLLLFLNNLINKMKA